MAQCCHQAGDGSEEPNSWRHGTQVATFLQDKPCASPDFLASCQKDLCLDKDSQRGSKNYGKVPGKAGIALYGNCPQFKTKINQMLSLCLFKPALQACSNAFMSEAKAGPSQHVPSQVWEGHYKGIKAGLVTRGGPQHLQTAKGLFLLSCSQFDV